MSRPRTLRRALLRPRGPQAHLRSRRSGVAFVTALIAIAVLTVIVLEVQLRAESRYFVALHRKEKTQALWLAHSGFNLYRLVLIADKGVGSQIDQAIEDAGIQVASTSLMDTFPALDTQHLRMITAGVTGDIDEPEEIQAAVEEYEENVDIEAAELFSGKDFLTFSGDFFVRFEDHESRLNINAFSSETGTNIQESPTGQTLYALMSGYEEDQWFYEQDIDRWDVISNLKDWVDTDTFRSGLSGGYEDDLYNSLDDPYLSKNSPFDSMQEIRLVDSWQDKLFERYKHQLTVYGDPSGKINIITAEDPLIKGIIRACASSLPTDATIDNCMTAVHQDIFSGNWQSGKAFADDIMSKCGVELETSCVSARVTTESKTYTVTSSGIVGTTEVTITAVLDFSGGDPAGELQYWRID
jgi:type II secretory pathway component PulK